MTDEPRPKLAQGAGFRHLLDFARRGAGPVMTGPQMPTADDPFASLEVYARSLAGESRLGKRDVAGQLRDGARAVDASRVAEDKPAVVDDAEVVVVPSGPSVLTAEDAIGFLSEELALGNIDQDTYEAEVASALAELP